MLVIELQGHLSNCPIWYKAFHCPRKKQRDMCYYSDKILNTDRVQFFFFFNQHGKLYLYSFEGVIHGTKMMT